MDIFEKDLSGAMVSPDEPGYDQLISTIFDTMKTAAEMNAKGWLSQEEVHDYLHRITGREIDPSTTLLPPFLRGLWQEHPHRQRLLDSARLHLLRPWRHHHRRGGIHCPESEPYHHQPRPESR